MIRAFLGIAVAALAVLAGAAPAGASPGQVYHSSVKGNYAQAYWFYGSPAGNKSASVTVSKSNQGSQLIVTQFAARNDSEGNFIGATSLRVDITSGYSYKLDQLLAGATVTASGVPAQVATYDADWNETDSATTVDVNVTWTAQGSIFHSVSNYHASSEGYRYATHDNGKLRDATAAGTVAGLVVDTATADEWDAQMGTANAGYVEVTIGP